MAPWPGSRPGADDTVYVAIHSFTQQLRGREKRPWHIGVLYGKDERFALPLLERLRRETDLCVGENEPLRRPPGRRQR